MKESVAVAEGRALLELYFGLDDPDNEHARIIDFRDGVIRLIILDLHLAIEDLLKNLLDLAADMDGGITRRQVVTMRTRETIDVAHELGILDTTLHEQLVALNTLRNHAGHIWILQPDTGEGQNQAPHPLLWRGDPLTTAVVRDTFLPLYGDIYQSMFGVYMREAYPDL